MAVPQPLPIGGNRSQAISLTLPNIPLWVPEAQRKVINDLVVNTMRLALQQAAGFISDEAPVDSGSLAASFGADPATTMGGQELIGVNAEAGINGRVFSGLPYAIVMDQGRRPGQPISRAGIDAIGLWAQRKLGLSADEAAGAKWAIANSIVARGIAPTGFFDKGVKAAEPRIEMLFVALAEQIGKSLVQEGGGR